ncbi:DUF1501 domain-containing protein [Synechococcus sp. PCC 7336]|uniref:DUF1501 domain-containing protein n=1 Tax=Synechococcus sp. PCC 7336 TaxID=195250 RepID=UPI0003468C27|nr:DUF1501 domain-containing protein [Synechococcus sp. PCC 7336]
MKRRSFLGRSATFAASSLATLGLSGWWLRQPARAASSRSLLVVFLRGGADSLNVLVPYGDPAYYSLRPTIAIAPPRRTNSQTDGAIALTEGFGLHPALADLLPLWQQGQLSFVPACGLRPASRSHFKAQDDLEVGSPDSKAIADGWMNRLLGQLSDGSVVQGVNFGGPTPLIMRGRQSVSNFPLRTATDAPNRRQVELADAFSQLYQGADTLGQAYREGREAQALLTDALQREMVESGRGAPSSRTFADRGHQLGQLLAAEVGTQVAFLSVGGWDTHVSQGGRAGRLADQLENLGRGLAALREGLGSALATTAIVVMSEFGRTAAENGNRGTDHGTAGLLWVLGGGFNGGHVFGTWPGLGESQLYQGRDLAVTTDIRDAIASVLAAQFQLDRTQLSEIFPGHSFTARLPLV